MGNGILDQINNSNSATYSSLSKKDIINITNNMESDSREMIMYSSIKGFEYMDKAIRMRALIETLKNL